MTSKRSESVMHNWHWLNTGDIDREDRQIRNRLNFYWTVQGFCDAVAESFAAHYVCPQRFDIDEQCIPRKGRHLSKCYNPIKPAKWHLKVYSLNSAETSYQL